MFFSSVAPPLSAAARHIATVTTDIIHLFRPFCQALFYLFYYFLIIFQGLHYIYVFFAGKTQDVGRGGRGFLAFVKENRALFLLVQERTGVLFRSIMFFSCAQQEDACTFSVSATEKVPKRPLLYYIKPCLYISAHACFRWRIAPSGSRYPAEVRVCTSHIYVKPRADNDIILAWLSRA